MKILLVGEYSRLHNSLKEGLQKLGHEVLLVGTGDYFKRYPVDINIDAIYFKYNTFLNFLRKGFYKITSIDLAHTETCIRYLFNINKFKNFDAVQLINSNAIKTHFSIEKFFISKLKKNNKALFLSACGDDYYFIEYLLNNNELKYHILTPYLNNPNLKKIFSIPLRYISKPYKKLYLFVYKNSNGIIASDIDYHLPLINDSKYLGMIPNPINTDKINYEPLKIDDKINIFYGENSSNKFKKGSDIIHDALQQITQKYPDKVNIKIVKDLPYSEYINIYNNSHILIDQVYSYDQGFNALEAMAKGKVVFTGAEQEWLRYYNLEKDTVVINATPDSDEIVKKLENLILNPGKILEISKNARSFIEREHNYVESSKKYITLWNKSEFLKTSN